MANLALKAGPAATVIRRELDPRSALPYARHVTEQIVGLDTQALMISFQLDGASFETADVRDLNDWHAKLNSAWRNLADDQLAIWHHLVRREHHGYPQGTFRSDFAAGLDDRYRARLGASRMFVNELYVTLVLHPGRDLADRAGAWLSRARQTAEPEYGDDAVKRLEDAGRDLAQYLAATACAHLPSINTTACGSRNRWSFCASCSPAGRSVCRSCVATWARRSTPRV